MLASAIYPLIKCLAKAMSLPWCQTPAFLYRPASGRCLAEHWECCELSHSHWSLCLSLAPRIADVWAPIWQQSKQQAAGQGHFILDHVVAFWEGWGRADTQSQTSTSYCPNPPEWSHVCNSSLYDTKYYEGQFAQQTKMSSSITAFYLCFS